MQRASVRVPALAFYSTFVFISTREMPQTFPPCTSLPGWLGMVVCSAPSATPSKGSSGYFILFCLLSIMLGCCQDFGPRLSWLSVSASESGRWSSESREIGVCMGLGTWVVYYCNLNLSLQSRPVVYHCSLNLSLQSRPVSLLELQQHSLPRIVRSPR